MKLVCQCYHKETRQKTHGSVWCFIDTQTGAVYKPASFKAPAKHIRYQLMDDASYQRALQRADWAGGWLYLNVICNHLGSMSDYIIPINGVAKLRKSQQPVNTIQYNIMSTMSELHRLMQEIKQDDLDILADIAYQQEQAMREGMEPPKAPSLPTLTLTMKTSSPITQMESTQRSDHTEIITHIIAFISVLLWPRQSSSSTSPVTPVPAQQDIGSTNTTGQKSLMVVPQKPSSSTTSAKSTAAPKKEAGGTKKAPRTKRTASSQRSNASTASSNSPKTWTSTINHPLMTAEVSPPFMPPSAQATPFTIPPSGLVIARYN